MLLAAWEIKLERTKMSNTEQFHFGPFSRICASAVNRVCAFSDLLADELD
jgi:hypothetical protein